MFASDKDATSPNNKVTYRLASGARDKFVVDPDSGVVSVSPGASLDPDLVTSTDGRKALSYHLELVAVDGGPGLNQLSGTASVNVTVIDVNNKPPSFASSELKPIRVLENARPGHFLTKLKASDPDSSSKLRYFLDAENSEAKNEEGRILTRREADAEDLFEIDSQSGEIRVVGELDREKIENIKLVVGVEDVNARVGPPQVATAVVHITVEDENDNRPEFGRSYYLASVMENSHEGTSIVKVLAKDIDKNKTVFYALEGTNDQLEHILIDAESGEVFAGHKNIDCESTTWLNLTIRATDSGRPAQSSYADLAIKVLDENDNGPAFVDDELSLSVPEDAPVGTVVARLQAEDDDGGEFGKITYFLDRHSTALGAFKIHPETGELSVFRALDRETDDSYNLLVEAYDNYQFGFSTGDSRHAFAQVSIKVTDINDEAPVFEEVEEEGQCTIITEFHEMTEPVLRVRARDADDPDTANGEIEFRILAGNELELFRMESDTGKILPRRQLKGFYGNYSLTVEARDKGRPPNFSRAQFSICVQVRERNINSLTCDYIMDLW